MLVKLFGGGVNSSDSGTGIAVDAAGNVYVTGTTTAFLGTATVRMNAGASVPATAGAFQVSSNAAGIGAILEPHLAKPTAASVSATADITTGSSGFAP